MICQTLTNPNSPSVLSKAKFSSAADWQMLSLRSSTPLATPKPFISLQSEATDSPSDPTAPLQREERPVLSKGGKFPGSPAHTVTVCLLVNVTFTGSQWRLSNKLHILTFPKKKKKTQWRNMADSGNHCQRQIQETILSVQENKLEIYSKEKRKQQQLHD